MTSTVSAKPVQHLRERPRCRLVIQEESFGRVANRDAEDVMPTAVARRELEADTMRLGVSG